MKNFKIEQLNTNIIKSTKFLPYDLYKKNLNSLIAKEIDKKDLNINKSDYMNFLDAIDATINNKISSVYKGISASNNFLHIEFDKDFSFSEDEIKTIIKENFNKNKNVEESVLNLDYLNDTTILNKIHNSITAGLNVIQTGLTYTPYKNYLARETNIKATVNLNNIISTVNTSILTTRVHKNYNTEYINNIINEFIDNYLKIKIKNIKKNPGKNIEISDIDKIDNSINTKEIFNAIANTKKSTKYVDTILLLKKYINEIHKIDDDIKQSINNSSSNSINASIVDVINFGEKIKNDYLNEDNINNLNNIFDEFKNKKSILINFLTKINDYINELKTNNPDEQNENNKENSSINFNIEIINTNIDKILKNLKSLHDTHKSQINESQITLIIILLKNIDTFFKIINVLLSILNDSIVNINAQSTKFESYAYKEFVNANGDLLQSIENTENFKNINMYFNILLYISPYFYTTYIINEIRHNFESLSGIVDIDDEGNLIDKSSVDLFNELQINDTERNTLMNIFVSKIADTKAGNVIYNWLETHKLIKTCLKSVGITSFSLGKMAIFFVLNGGFETFNKGLSLLKSWPKEFFKKSIITPQEARDVYYAINKDAEAKSAYAKLSKILTGNIDRKPIFQKFIEFYGKHKDHNPNNNTINALLLYFKSLVFNIKVLKIFAKTTKTNILDTNFTAKFFYGLHANNIKIVLKFMDEMIQSDLTAEEIIKEYDKLTKNSKTSKIFNKDATKDTMSIMYYNIIRMYTSGAAGMASNYNGRKINFKEMFDFDD